MFLLSFVIFTFTALTSVIAQTKTSGKISCNFQETVTNPHPYLMNTDEEKAHRKHGIIPAGITVFHTGITREMVDQPAVREAVSKNVSSDFKKMLVELNTQIQFLAPKGMLTTDVYEKNIDRVDAAIKVGTFDFHGQPGTMSANQWSGNNLVAGSVMVEHDAVRTLECFYLDLGSLGIFPYKATGCANTFGNKLVMAVKNGTANLVSESADNNTQNLKPGNTGNGNGNGSGNTETVTVSKADLEAMLTVAKNNSGNAPIIINFAGNNNGNNNGGQGGSVAGGRDGANGRDGVNGTNYDRFNPEVKWSENSRSSNQNRNVSSGGEWVKTGSGVVSTNSSTVSTGNGLACGTCGETAWTRKDVAFVESELVQGNKIAKSQRDWQIAGFVFDRAKDAYDITTDIMGPQGRWKKPQFGGTWTNNASTGNPADWVN